MTRHREIKTHRSRRSKFGIRPRHRYLSVSNGRVTEQEYFRDISIALPNGRLIPRFCNGSPDKVIEKAIELRDASAADPYDEVFAVCDVDNFARKQIMVYQKYARDNGITMIFSGPCFEVWLLCYLGKVLGSASTIVGAQSEAKKQGLVNKDKTLAKDFTNMDHKLAIETAGQLRKTYGSNVSVDWPTTDMDKMLKVLLLE